MKTMLWGSVALAGFAVGANAADMPPVPLPPPLPVVADCWTGFYVGGNLGYHMSQDIISSTADPLGWGVDGASVIDTRSPTWLGSRGAIVGGQIGFNWQLGNVVFGWEVDGQWLGGSANRQYTFSGAVMPVTGDFMYNSSATNVAATLRPRLGATFGNLLVYGTGGLAMGWYSNTDSFASFGGATLATTPSTTVRPGWTGGGGLEWKFLPQWSVKAEYLYLHMQNYNARIASCDGCATGSDILIHHNVTDNFVRMGVNWHVNPW